MVVAAGQPIEDGPLSQTYPEHPVCHLYVALEGRKVGAIPMQVNVVEVAATIAGVDHLSQPV